MRQYQQNIVKPMSLTAISGGAAAPTPENIKSAAPQRVTPSASGDGKPSAGLPAPTPHANRVGVAAYLSVMNPVPAASVHAEA